jgi:hypothetical protein
MTQPLKGRGGFMQCWDWTPESFLDGIKRIEDGSPAETAAALSGLQGPRAV